MDESRLVEMGLLSASFGKRASKRLTSSPVISMVDRVRRRVHATKLQQEKEKEISNVAKLQQKQEDMEHPPRNSSFGWRKSHAVKLSTSSKLLRTSSITTFVTAPDSPHSLGSASPFNATKVPTASIVPSEAKSEDEVVSNFDPAAPSIIDKNLFTHPEGELGPEAEPTAFSIKINDPVTPDNASECSSIITLTPSFDSEISLTSTNLAFFPTPPKGFERGYLQPRALTSAEKRKWKTMTDDVVKGYLTENHLFAARLDILRKRAQGAGHEEFEKSCNDMMADTIRNRLDIMGVGNCIHKSIDAEIEVSVVRTEMEGRSSGLSSRTNSSLAIPVKKEARPISWG